MSVIPAGLFQADSNASWVQVVLTPAEIFQNSNLDAF